MHPHTNVIKASKHPPTCHATAQSRYISQAKATEKKRAVLAINDNVSLG